MAKGNHSLEAHVRKRLSRLVGLPILATRNRGRRYTESHRLHLMHVFIVYQGKPRKGLTLACNRQAGFHGAGGNVALVKLAAAS